MSSIVRSTPSRSGTTIVSPRHPSGFAIEMATGSGVLDAISELRRLCVHAGVLPTSRMRRAGLPRTGPWFGSLLVVVRGSRRTVDRGDLDGPSLHPALRGTERVGGEHAFHNPLAARGQLWRQVRDDSELDLGLGLLPPRFALDFDALLRDEGLESGQSGLQVLERRVEDAESPPEPATPFEPLRQEPLRVAAVQPLDHLPDQASGEEGSPLDVLRQAGRLPGGGEIARAPALAEEPEGHVEDLVCGRAERPAPGPGLGRQGLRRAR